MSKTAVAFGSLLVGLSITVGWLLGSQTSTWAQPLRSTAPPGGAGIVVEGAEPVVPSLRSPIVEMTLVNATQSLDGLNCEKCRFTNVVFTYAGGAFRCVGCTFTGSLRFEVKGAAINTLGMLTLTQALAMGAPTSGPATPLATKTVPIISPITADFISPQ